MTWRPDYITTAQLKQLARVSNAVDDWWFALVVAGVSRAIDKATGRQFGAVAAPEARSYPVRYSRHRDRWLVDIDDLQTAVGAVWPVGVDPPTLEPRNAVVDGLAWTQAVFSADPSDADGMVTMTAPWGWAAVPSTVTTAALLQGSRFIARRESPFGVAGSPQTGSELRLLERLDPDVAVSIKFYERTWVAR